MKHGMNRGFSGEIPNMDESMMEQFGGAKGNRGQANGENTNSIESIEKTETES